MKEGRIVYSYRSWRRFFRALFWSTWGLFVAVGAVWDLFQPLPKYNHTSFDPTLMRWVLAIGMTGMVLSELTKGLEFLFERIVISGTTLTYYNWLGLKRTSVELSEVRSVALGIGPRWEVDTPSGCVFFNEDLKKYRELIEQLRSAGATVGFVKPQL